MFDLVMSWHVQVAALVTLLTSAAYCAGVIIGYRRAYRDHMVQFEAFCSETNRRYDALRVKLGLDKDDE